MNSINNELYNLNGQQWVSRSYLQSRMTTEERQADEYNRNVCSILNKITPQNFRKMLTRMINLNVNNEDKVQTIVRFVFQKCMDEYLYSEVYANFCSILMEQIKTTSASCATLFLKLLYEEAENITIEILNTIDPEEKTFLERHQAFCSVIFIGQLFVKNIISDVFIHNNFIKQLLTKYSTCQQRFEYQLECLFKILKIIGYTLETQQNKQHMDSYFENLENIYKNEKASTRIKMLLLDLLELRHNQWRERRRKEKPVTIDQIRSQKGENVKYLENNSLNPH